MERYIAPSRRGACTECGKVIQINRTSAAEPRCRDCWRQMPRDVVPCRECSRPSFARGLCSTHYSYWHRQRNGRKPSRRMQKVCGWCGIEYVTSYSVGSACCVTHGLWLLHYGVPSQSRELAVVPREPKRRGSRLKTPAPAKRWWRVVVQGRCAWCGEMFTAPSTTGVAAYCSKRCSRSAAKMAHGKRFIVEPDRRRRLYERDGWMCRICGEATSRIYDEADPWSPTLDHIEPQSATLLPDHSDGNLRTAHALCNSIRSDGVLTDDEVRALALARRQEVLNHGPIDLAGSLESRALANV